MLLCSRREAWLPDIDGKCFVCTPAGAVDGNEMQQVYANKFLGVDLPVVCLSSEGVARLWICTEQTPQPRLVEANAASSCQAMAHAASLSE
jgi:hypothetical protein